MLRNTDLAAPGAEPERAARRLRVAADAGRLAVWEADFRSEVMHVTPELLRLFGFPEGEPPDIDRIRAGYAPGERERLREVMLEAVREGRSFVEAEFRYRRADGVRRWLLLRAEMDGASETAFGVVMDVTDRKEAEERQRMLSAELNYRVKNTLAIVQAMAAQTFREGADMASARESFAARLSALAGTHDLLVGTGWQRADLKGLVAKTLEHCWDSARMSAEGPGVSVPPSLALALSLALHELSTNAVKYGSLSVPTGRVTVRWNMEPGAGLLTVLWQEAGGPPVTLPATKGFGTRLIERVLGSDGVSRLDFDPVGLRCLLTAKIPPQTGERYG